MAIHGVDLERIVAESAIVAFATFALSPESAGNESHLIRLGLVRANSGPL